MIMSSAQTATFSRSKANLQQPYVEYDEAPAPSSLKFSLPTNFFRWLLISVFVSMCYLALFVISGLTPVQGAAKLATAVEPASLPTRENELAGEHLFQTYTVWLRASHAHAVAHAQEAPLPSQF